MKTGYQVFEKSSGSIGWITAVHQDCVYVTFRNGRRAYLHKKEVSYTMFQFLMIIFNAIRGIREKIYKCVKSMPNVFISMPTYLLVILLVVIFMLFGLLPVFVFLAY